MKYKTCFEHGVKYKESCPVCDADRLFKTEMFEPEEDFEIRKLLAAQMNDAIFERIKVTSSSKQIDKGEMNERLKSIHKKFSIVSLDASCKIRLQLGKEQTKN